MTYTWTYLQENPHETKRLIGISYPNLIELMEMAKNLDKKHKEKVEKQKIRLIRAGGGAKSKLSVEDQIVLTRSLPSSNSNISGFRVTFERK